MTAGANTVLDPKLLQAIHQKVIRRFPEVSRVKPQVKRQRPPDAPPGTASNYLLLYKTTARGPGGRSIPRVVRVVVSPQGKVIKMTTSR